MNVGGLVLLSLLSVLALLARHSLRGATGSIAAVQRRALLVLALALPLLGVVLPLVPWKAAALGIVLLAAVAIEVVLRAFGCHESATERGDRG
jgi:hypothetical protein